MCIRTVPRWFMARSGSPGARPMRAADVWHRRWRGAGSARTTRSRSMAPNIPAMYEAHFGVPMCGAVLNTLNTRLDAETIAFMLRHGGARALITDREFSATIEQALALLEQRPLVIDIDDPSYQGGKALGEIGYEAFLAEGDPDYAWQGPADEWDAISLNYTSGTTGDPKGVVYHHRGAYLNAISNVLRLGHAVARGVSVDAADVPLQRLVLPVVDRRARRHQRVPASCRGEGGARCDPRPPA